MTEQRRCCLASGFPPFHHSIDCTLRGHAPHVAPTTECSDDSPPWFVGHWRDWHRGHGCDKDDGKPRSAAAVIEIVQHAANEATGYLTDAELGALRASTTAGNTLLMRALDELSARRGATNRSEFDHSLRTVKYFEVPLGFCVCPHCEKLPANETAAENPDP